jgi:hypothetical protein
MMLTVKQAATRIGVSEALVYGWCSVGLLPHFRLGGRGKRGGIRIAEPDLETFLQGCRVGQDEPQSVAAPTPVPKRISLRHLRLPPG